jgi:quinol monooxygenase YgiN
MKYRMSFFMVVFFLALSVLGAPGIGAERTEPQEVNIIAFMRPKTGKGFALRTALLAMAVPTRLESGCLAYNVHQEKDSSIFLYEVWQSKTDLDSHFQTAYLRDFVAKMPEWLDGGNDWHMGELVIDPQTTVVNPVPLAQSGSAIYIGTLLHARPGRASDLRNYLLSCMAKARKEPGCIGYNLYQEKDGTMFWYEVWASQVNLDMHVKQPYVKDFGCTMDGLASSAKVHVGALISSDK